MPADKDLKETVKWFNVAEELIGDGDAVLAAVSGGGDSMALLHVLHGLSQELGFSLAVAYFDHRMRKSNEHAFVETQSQQLGVPFYSGEADVPALAASTGESIEAAARKARYTFLEAVANQIGATKIATGHTQDDQAETVLMRALRGTGVRGLAGIPVRRGNIIRPLLCVNRTDTLAYCADNEIGFVDDPTNSDRRFLRNRIRHELMPLLEGGYLGGVRENLLTLAKNAQELLETVREKTRPLIGQNLKQVSEGEWTFNLSPIASLDSNALFVLFSDVFINELGCDHDFSRANYEDLSRLIRDARGTKRLDLPGLSVRREYENLIITRDEGGPLSPSPVGQRTILTLPGETQAVGMHIETEIMERSVLEKQSMKASESVAYFDFQRLRLPLTLRNPESGDRMQPFGMAGTKKLSDIFIDRKIPEPRRKHACLVEDAESILWLIGVATAEKCRVAPETSRVVRISVQPKDDRVR